jgi:hypothetical protein
MAAARPSPLPTVRASTRQLFVGGQDHWHSLRVDGLDDGIRRRGQELQEFPNRSDVANI